jgi:hypothetical protein
MSRVSALSLPLGSRVVRSDDGKIGEIRMEGGEPRVVYADRGNVLVAPKKEKWEAFEGPPAKLRPEEIAEVARVADLALEAVETHRPFPFMEVLAGRDPQNIAMGTTPIRDAGLVAVITRYLAER